MLKPFTFRAAPDSPRFLKKHFSAVSLANNHCGDFGNAGGIPHAIVEEDLLPNAQGSMPTAEPPADGK